MGLHRTQHLEPSKGVRAKKRKRSEPKSERPSPPAIATDIKVGLNSVTRAMESQAAVIPSAHQPLPRIIAVVFLPKHKDDMAVAHLPVLAAYASLTKSTTSAIRIVAFDVIAEKRLATVLGLPRVGAVGIMEGGEGSALVDFVRKHVAPVDVPWIREAGSAKYLALKVAVQESKSTREQKGKSKSAAAPPKETTTKAEILV